MAVVKLMQMFLWRNLIKIFLKICSMPPVPIKNKLDNVSDLKTIKESTLKKNCLPAQKEYILINEAKEIKRDLATAIEEWSSSFCRNH